MAASVDVDSNGIDFAQSSIIIITGASRGIGATLAHLLAAELTADSLFVLFARSEDGLRQTQSAIEAASRAGRCRVSIHPCDLASETASSLKAKLDLALQTHRFAPNEFKNLLLINNAGSLGSVARRVVDYFDAASSSSPSSPAVAADSATGGATDRDEIERYFQFNFISPWMLTSVVLNMFKKNDADKAGTADMGDKGRKMEQQIVVNMSSLAAMEPFKCWSLYCAGKAARDSLFRVLAIENPSVRVLNYAPGLTDTEMVKEARANIGDEQFRQEYDGFCRSEYFLSPTVTMTKLIGILRASTFKSGSHVDYWDPLA